MSKSTIAQNIRKMRLDKGLTQEKLARLADLAFPTIAKIESGETPNPSINTVKKIAGALGVGVDDLIK